MHAPTLLTTELTTIFVTLLHASLLVSVGAPLCVYRDLSVAMLYLQPVPSSCWCLMDFMRCVVLSYI